MKILWLASLCLGALRPALQAQRRVAGNIHEESRIKISLNFYSFHTPLLEGRETIESVIDYCADTGFDAVDLTGYYFKSYPKPPSDDCLYRVKYHAFRQGIQISGTGVRNDFSLPDAAAREKEIQHVKDWIVVAAKLGAPALRIFSGARAPEGDTWEETARRIAAAIDECAGFARQYGLVLAVQNHNDFLKTAEEVEKLFALFQSEDVGLMIDIGSFRADPYREIAQCLPYAVSWQLKEHVYVGGVETKTDLPRVMDLILRSGYRGYVPIEILGKGAERERAAAMYGQARLRVEAAANRQACP